MTAAKWENRFHDQVTANNLLGDKLRETRKLGQKMIGSLQMAYLEQKDKIKDLEYTIQLLETAILKEVSGYDDNGKPK